MAKTNHMRRVERDTGRRLEELLPSLFEALHTNEAVAEALGISSLSLTRWLDRLGATVTRERFVQHRTTVQIPEQSSAS